MDVFNVDGVFPRGAPKGVSRAGGAKGFTGFWKPVKTVLGVHSRDKQFGNSAGENTPLRRALINRRRGV